MPNRIRLATRGSALARWQAERVAEKIRNRLPGTQVELVIIATTADKHPDRPLHELGDKGLFVKEIEEALLNRDADAGVHSLKDLPGSLPDGLGLAAVTERCDPRDALLSRGHLTIDALPPGARVATTSLRRRGQLLRLRPDIEVVAVRGNVDTRIRKLTQGDFDALVLAVAGLERLGLSEHITQVFPCDKMLPAAGQGAIGVETLYESQCGELWQSIDDADARLAVDAERLFVRVLGGDCKTPIGCRCEILAGHSEFRGMVCSPDGKLYLAARTAAHRDLPWMAAETAAEELLSAGAAELLQNVRDSQNE